MPSHSTDICLSVKLKHVGSLLKCIKAIKNGYTRHSRTREDNLQRLGNAKECFGVRCLVSLFWVRLFLRYLESADKLADSPKAATSYHAP